MAEIEKGKKYKQLLGAKGEAAAARYLRQHGYRIVERNFRCALGELDLIAYKGDTLVFVEVRTNSPAFAGMAEASIGWRKQRKLRQLATYYLKLKGLLEHPCRFDVVIVLFDEERPQSCEVRIIDNAF